MDRYIDNYTDSQQQGVNAWPYFEAWRQQWTCVGPGCEAWEEKGAQISIWCVGQKYGDSKCRMNNHIYYKERKYMSFNINNHHDKILIPEVGGQIKWYLIGVIQSKTHIHNLSIIYSMVKCSIFLNIFDYAQEELQKSFPKFIKQCKCCLHQ